MRYLIDAWLETRHPRLRLIDCETGQVRQEWDATHLRRWFEQGELAPGDFATSDPRELKKLIQELLPDCRETAASRCIGCGRCRQTLATGPHQPAQATLFQCAVEHGPHGSRVLEFPDLLHKRPRL